MPLVCIPLLDSVAGEDKTLWIIKKHNIAPTNKNKRLRDNDQDSDTDSNNERSYNSCNNWPRFLVEESSSDDLPLSKLSTFAVQEGFQAVAGTLKSIKMFEGWIFPGGVL